MWINRIRGTPAKYQEALRAYTAVMLEQAALDRIKVS